MSYKGDNSLIRSNADIVAAFPGSSTNVLDAEVGHILGVMRPILGRGIRVRWASLSGTPDVTLTLYDNTPVVLAAVNQPVTTVPTTYDVLFAAPVDLTAYQFDDLIISAWENIAGVSTNNYYSALTTNFATHATPLPIGDGLESRGSAYMVPGGSAPLITTGIEIYGVDLIWSFLLWLTRLGSWAP